MKKTTKPKVIAKLTGKTGKSKGCGCGTNKSTK